jgi:hypothetical protein
MGTPTARANFPRTFIDCEKFPILLCINILAVIRSTATLIVSDGWKLKGPKASHRCDP